MSDRNTTPRPLVEKAVREMGPALKSRCEEARSHLRNATHTDAMARYRVARIVVEIRRDVERYETGAVSLLGQALSRDETTLYRYARVAEVWSEPEFAEIIGYRMADGSPLSWSHLMEIATLPSRKERERMVQDTLTRGLSVKAIAAIIRHQEPSAPSSRSPSLSRIRRFVDACNTLERVGLDEKVLESLEATPEALETLRDAKFARERARNLLERYGSLISMTEQRVLRQPPETGLRVKPPSESELEEDADQEAPTTVGKRMLLFGMDPDPKKGGRSS